MYIHNNWLTFSSVFLPWYYSVHLWVVIVFYLTTKKQSLSVSLSILFYFIFFSILSDLACLLLFSLSKKVNTYPVVKNNYNTKHLRQFITMVASMSTLTTTSKIKQWITEIESQQLSSIPNTYCWPKLLPINTPPPTFQTRFRPWILALCSSMIASKLLSHT